MICASASLGDNETFTIGDVLAGSISREMDRLPPEEQVERADRSLEALLASSEGEFAALERDLQRKLGAAELRTTAELQRGRQLMEATVDEAFDVAEMELNSCLRSTRQSVSDALQRLRVEEAARLESERRRRSSLSGFARSSSWRDTDALARSAARPKHPVVLVAEASALTLSVMIMLVFYDFATGQHLVTRPPPHRIVRMQVQSPQRTTSSTTSTSAPTPSPPSTRSYYAEEAAHAPDSRPYAAAALPRAGFWTALRAVAMVLAASFGTIMLRSGTDDWAATALGLEPCDSDALGTSSNDKNSTARSSAVRYTFDWDRNVWREE